MKKTTLWTKNFTCISIATVLSAIAGEAMTLPISLLVFDETKSTLLVSIIFVVSMLADIVFSVFVAPLIDKYSKKKWILCLDAMLMIVYIVMGTVVIYIQFNFLIYVLFTFIVGCISVMYRLAYTALFPDMIPIGFEQKGYAVSGSIYPTIVIVMSPIATVMYLCLNMSVIFYLVAFIIAIAILVESRIVEKESIKKKQKYTLKQYTQDLVQGFTYMKKEKGLRNIYTYMGIANGVSSGVNVLTQAFFQSSSKVSVAMYGFLKSGEMIGRVCGSVFQYLKEVPLKKRYRFTKFVYFIYESLHALLLLLPFYGMLVNAFARGALGSVSATIRESAVQSYLPATIRARIHAIMNMMFSIMNVLFQLLAGYIGEVLPYAWGVFLLCSFCLCIMYICIVLPKHVNRCVYEAQREQ